MSYCVVVVCSAEKTQANSWELVVLKDFGQRPEDASASPLDRVKMSRLDSGLPVCEHNKIAFPVLDAKLAVLFEAGLSSGCRPPPRVAVLAKYQAARLHGRLSCKSYD